MSAELVSVVPAFLRETYVSTALLTQRVTTRGFTPNEAKQISDCIVVEIALHQRKTFAKASSEVNPTIKVSAGARIIKCESKVSGKQQKQVNHSAYAQETPDSGFKTTASET